MKKYIGLILALLVLVIAGCTQVPQEKKETTEIKGDATLQVQFLDVGQGDSILVIAPNGKTMLVDAGTKGAGRNVASYIKGLGITKLDFVVATHPDADHIGGLVPILQELEVGTFVDSGKEHTSQTFIDMLTLIDEHDINYEVPTIGESWQLDKKVKVEVLYANEAAKDNNDASIVLRVSYGEVSYLLTGDAGIKLEKEMLANGDVQATFLKAGHHGSNTSSSHEFIKAVQPEVAILSYGEGNKYGHPHKEVVDALIAEDVEIYSTAESGTIITATDGVHYSITGVPFEHLEGKKPTGVSITRKDLIGEEVDITNGSNEAVSLYNWQLISVEGNQIFTFPDVTLQPGKKITVTSGSGAKEGKHHIKWTGKQIWLNDGDAAILKDAKGAVVSELD